MGDVRSVEVNFTSADLGREELERRALSRVRCVRGERADKVGLEGVQGLTDAVFAMGRMIREARKDPVTAQAVRQWS